MIKLCRRRPEEDPRKENPRRTQERPEEDQKKTRRGPEEDQKRTRRRPEEDQGCQETESDQHQGSVLIQRQANSRDVIKSCGTIERLGGKRVRSPTYPTYPENQLFPGTFIVLLSCLYLCRQRRQMWAVAASGDLASFSLCHGCACVPTSCHVESWPNVFAFKLRSPDFSALWQTSLCSCSRRSYCRICFDRRCRALRRRSYLNLLRCQHPGHSLLEVYVPFEARHHASVPLFHCGRLCRWRGTRVASSCWRVRVLELSAASRSDTMCNRGRSGPLIRRTRCLCRALWLVEWCARSYHDS
ncbi:hypothetical protein BCR34DRAFT_362660 [Clohesyomyces aquaticus]|uniref:Uncharacterized protein n=1 Tax=Clohesyomyces aquaticus TaxID=1231657 RepID=A0A1Y1ZI08_9PLEO|nr:hypothetical protein BCR34DRAFT_362660 [Clohesyomyces aquaticus]